jgi:lipopolysaccharide exporter
MGSFVGFRAAGLFNVGQQLAEMPLGEFLPVVNRALYPGLLRVKDDLDKLRSAALEAMGFLAALSIPMAVGFSFVAPEIVRIIYGKQWEAAIPIIRILALASAFETVGSSVVVSVAMTKAENRFLFMRSLWRGLFRLPTFILGVWFFGLTGGVIGSLVGSVVLLISNMSITCILLETTLVAIGVRLWRSIVGVTVMTIVLILVQHAVPPETTTAADTWRLILSVAAGAVTYGLVRILIWTISGVPDSLEIRALALLTRIRGRGLRSPV